MRAIKMIVLGLLAVLLIALGVANMAAVDLYLLPAGLTGDEFGVKGIPLAAVILMAVFLGIVIGLFMEFIRERKHRVVADDKRREIVMLRQEIARLRARLGDKGDDLPRIPAA